MVVWGVFWGVLLGFLIADEAGDGLFWGVVLGSLAGLWLDKAVAKVARREWDDCARRAGRSAEAAEGQMAARADASATPADVPASADVAVPHREAAGHAAVPPPLPAAVVSAASELLAVPEPPAASVSPAVPAASVAAQAAMQAAPLPDFDDSFFDTPPVAPAASAASAPPAEPARPVAPAAVAARVAEDADEANANDPVTRALNWLLGGNTIVRVGLVILFIGLSFLVRYAAQAGLLPLPLRLLAVAATGAALLAVGWRQRLRKPGFGLSLQGAGVAVLYLTVFAAFRLGVMASQALAFALMVLTCAGGCALALGQNARALAFVAFAGGFATPLLLSTGQGNVAALFGYYALLGLGIAAIAARRAWRELNWLGAVSTFGLATAWGVLRYTSAEWDTAQPFLLMFMGIYVAVTLLYARQSGSADSRAVDAPLVFGVPLVGFALQAGMVRHMAYGPAWSALGFGVAYLLLWAWLTHGVRASARQGWQLMATCFLALGVGFVTLAVPLALDERGTALAWSLEGAAVFWVGVRQARWRARAFGLVMQGVAALTLPPSLHWPPNGAWPLAHPDFLSVAMLALAALLCAWLLRDPLNDDARPVVATANAPQSWAGIYKELENMLGLPLLLYGFALWALAWLLEFNRVPAVGLPPVFASGTALQLTLLAVLLSAALMRHLANRWRWRDAAWPSRLALPVLWLALLLLWDMDMCALDGIGPVLWPLALALQWGFMWMHEKQTRQEDAPALSAWRHPASAWLALLVLGDAALDIIHRLKLPGDWQAATVLTTCAAALWALVAWAAHPASRPPRYWPLRPHAAAYLWRAAMPLVAFTALFALGLTCAAAGTTPPLPYVPVLNPVDAAVLLALGSVWLWRRAVLAAQPCIESARPYLAGLPFWGAFGAVAFIAANTLWLRMAHHYFGVPWSARELGSSFVVQAGYSLWWTLMALALMVAAHRRQQRAPWMAGAFLLCLVVTKLFFIDLANTDGGERIFAFIGVGVLMLVMGYAAPLPPRR